MADTTIGIVLEIVAVLGSGFIGGVLNCLLLDGGFIKPHKNTDEDGLSIWDPGFLSKVALGIGASMIVWGLGACELPFKRMLAMCILAGIGGGNLIASILQRRELRLEMQKADALEEVSKKCFLMVEKQLDKGKNDEQ